MGRSYCSMRVCVEVCVSVNVRVHTQRERMLVWGPTFLCLSLLPLKHLLLWRQSLLQELHVKLVLLLHLLLLPEAHLIAHVALEAEAQRDHRVADAAKTDNESIGQSINE